MLSRLKFEVEPLVTEMLDQLPDSVWISDSTTFFDPAIGGGQFVKEIEARLRAKGHSDVNIRNRVFGFEESDLHIRFAVNKHSLVGQYTKLSYAKFLELDDTVKFDVVIGNPPYKESKEHGKKTTGNGALWVKFTVKAFDIVKDNGYIGFVIPDSWTAPTYDLMGSRKSIFNDYFKKNNLFYVNFDVKKYFANVGIDSSAFLLQKTSSYSGTKVITPTETVSIDVTKLSFIPRDTSPVSLKIHSKILSSKENTRLFKMRWKKEIMTIVAQEDKSRKFKYPFIDHHSYKPVRWADRLDPDATKRKVLVPYVGKYQCIVDDAGELGARENVSVLFLKDKEKGEYAKQFFSSKLIRFVMNTNQWTQYQLSQILNFIPIEDFSQEWTDQKIYKHFGLAKDEIAHIEQTVI